VCNRMNSQLHANAKRPSLESSASARSSPGKAPTKPSRARDEAPGREQACSSHYVCTIGINRVEP
jgi:hypothetical protein